MGKRDHVARVTNQSDFLAPPVQEASPLNGGHNLPEKYPIFLLNSQLSSSVNMERENRLLQNKGKLLNSLIGENVEYISGKGTEQCGDLHQQYLLERTVPPESNCKF